MTDWYEDLMSGTETKVEKLGWYDRLMRDVKPTEIVSVPTPTPSGEPLPSYERRAEMMAAEYPAAVKEPDIERLGELIKPTEETLKHAGAGVLAFFPGIASGVGEMIRQKGLNVLSYMAAGPFPSEEYAFKQKLAAAKSLPEYKEVYESEMYKKARNQLLLEQYRKSPEEIREKVVDAAGIWTDWMKPPETEEAKANLELLDIVMSDMLFHYPHKLDKWISDRGHPNLGWGLGIVGELTALKMMHSSGREAKNLIKKQMEFTKDLNLEIPSEGVEGGRGAITGDTVVKVRKSLGKHLDEMGIPKEEVATPEKMQEYVDKTYGRPTKDALKQPTKRQRIYAHQVMREKGFSKAEYMEIADRVAGVTSIKDMTKESAKRFIDVLKEGKEKPVEVAKKPEEVVEIPELKSTGEAYAFGKKATSAQVEELKRLRKVQDVKIESLRKEGKLQEGFDEAVRGQFYDEALQMVKGTKQYEAFKKAKEVRDAEEVRRETREAGEKERIERGEERQVRLRDAEKDRLEARRREAKEEVVEEPIFETVKLSISDDLRVAQDMGFYVDIKEMTAKGLKIGTIMKELKQKPYYKEDLADFGYTEVDIRRAVRAVKADAGDRTAIRQVREEIKKEEVEVERVEEKVVEPPVDIERVDPITGRPPGVERVLERAPIEPEAIERLKLRQQPITGETGKVLRSQYAARIRAERLGKTGELVKHPSGEGWILKRTEVERKVEAKVRKEEVIEEQKEWEMILKEEELDLTERGLGERVDVDVDTIFNPFGNEEGALKIFKNISNKISNIKKRASIKKNRMFLESLLSKQSLDRMDRKNIIKLGSSIIRQSDKLKNTKYSDNIKRSDNNYVVITDDGNISILGSSTLGETLSNLNHPDFDNFGYLFNKLKNNTVISKLRKEFLSGLIDGNEYRRARSTIGLPDDAKSIIDIAKGERGAITIDAKTVKKLQDLVRRGRFSSNRIIKELRARGAVDKDILKVFPDASVQIMNKDIKSKWWKPGQDSLALLPRRRLPNKLKAPAITRGEAHMIATMNDISARLTAEHLSWENAIRTFEKLPTEVKETFYRSVKEGESLAFDHLQTVLKQSKKIRNSVRYTSHKRIGVHAIAQQPDGLAVLAQQGITKIPKLKSKEIKAYEDLRTIYDDFFPRLNRARIVSGQKPFPKMENYFTWIQDLIWLEKTQGVSLFSDWRTIESKMAEIKKVPSFRFAELRAGPEVPRKLNLNPFAIMDIYAKSATRYIEMAPRLAKLNELLTEKFGMAQNAPHAYNFLRHWLNYQAGKIPAWDITHPTTRRIMQVLNSNIVYSLLTYNVRSALIQPAALASSYTMIGEYYMGVGMSHMMSPAKWKMAGKKSNILNTRSPEVAIYEAMEIGGKLPGQIKKGVAKVGITPLTVLDSVAARVTWLGAYAKGLKDFKSERKAINYADDIVTRTQASAARSDVAPIQRTQLGKTVTCLQTFVINHWGFLTKDVLGIKNAKIDNPTTVKRVIRFILATTAVNAFYEDGLKMNSPNPTPIRAYREKFEETEDHLAAFARGVKEIAEYVPLWGGRLRYGSEVGGPVLTELLKLIGEGDTDALIKLMGIPGSNQFFKMVRAYERSGIPVDVLLGRYVEPPKGITAPMKGIKKLTAPIEVP